MQNEFMVFLKRHWCSLVLILAPLIFVGPAVFSSNCIGAFDQIRQMSPWNGPAPTQPWDVLQADSVLQFYPWRKMVFEAWGSGQVPFWNPYQLCGAPLLANSQSAAFYPPHILLGVLHVPVETAIDLLAWFHLAIAGLGVAALVRRFGGNEIGALTSGLAFSLSPFMLSWTALASVISTCAWIPWIMAGLVSLLGQFETVPTEKQVRLGVFCVAASTAMMLLAGHLQFSAYGLIGSLLLALGLVIVRQFEKSPKSLALATMSILAVACGGLLAMPQIKPVLEYSEFSHRKNVPSEEGYQGYLGLALRADESLGRLINPLAQGNPRKPLEGVSEYLPAAVRHGANYAESAITIGPIMLFGALLGLFAWKSKLKWAIAIPALITFSMACGSPLNRLLYFYAPGWSATGSPGRIEVVFLLFASILGGMGLSKLSECDDRQFGLATIFMLGISLNSLFIGGFSLPDGIASTQSLDTAVTAINSSHRFVVLIALVPIIYLGYFLRKHVAFSQLLPAFAVAFLLFTGTQSLIMAGDLNLQAKTPASPYERFAVVNQPWGLVAAAPAIFPPNTASISGLTDFGGYDSLLHSDTFAMFNEINDPRDSAPEANGNMLFLKPGYDPVKLGEAGVTRVFQRIPGSTSFEEIIVPSRGRAFTKSKSATIELDGYDRQVLKTIEGGTLTIKDRNMPGWTATVDGKPVPMQGTRWKEIELGGDGEHRVELRYSPPGMGKGVLSAICGVILLIGIVIWPKKMVIPTGSDEKVGVQ
jgi:hypothetical protein